LLRKIYYKFFYLDEWGIKINKVSFKAVLTATKRISNGVKFKKTKQNARINKRWRKSRKRKNK